MVKHYDDYSRIYTKTYQNASIKKTGKGFEIEYAQRTRAISSLEFIENEFSNDNAKKNLTGIFESSVFDYSKPVSLLHACAKMSTKNDDLILDFFSGSATTAHAVMQLNAEDGGNRKFIMVQLPEETDKIKKLVIDYVNHYRVTAYDEETQKGLLRHIYVRRGAVSGQVLVCLVLNGRKLPHTEDLIGRLQKVPGFTTLVLSVNTKPGNSILGDEFMNLYGPGYIEDTLCGLQFRLSPRSFYQVNHHQAQRLYENAIAQAGITKDDLVLDLYCGVGTITLCMAKAAGKVIGVEVVEQAVIDARENAARNHIDNAEFFCGDAGKAALELEAKGIRPDVVVVDPPRKGLNADTIDALAKMSPRRIVYVSCDPATLARDVALLKEHGYKLKNAQAADLFPRCAHVESIAVLEK